MKERRERLSDFLGRAGAHPLLWLAIAAFLIWRGYSLYVPHIASAALDGERLIVRGRSFGPRGGGSALVHDSGNRRRHLEIVHWEGERIVARAAGNLASGSIRVERAIFSWPVRSAPVAVIVPATGLPSQPFGYRVPVLPSSPWPLFRRDHRNTGNAPIPAGYDGGTPWSFRTGKGIFSTPVIDGDGAVYVGSADRSFYAISAVGRELWRYTTGGVIDSAAALLRPDSPGNPPSVVVASGDGHVYNLRTGTGSRDAREAWKLDARISPRASYNNWFEGNVAVGYDGTLYAGNTNFNYYAIEPNGELRWTYETQANNWSMAALGDDGTIYWGSNDSYVHAVRPDGTPRWTKRTWGMIAASAAVGSDGTVYIGSFDSRLYALDPEDGSVRWTFETGDHIYASVALGEDDNGRTNALYFGSTDGRFYALAASGEVLWTYDVGEPIRSSAAIGLGPRGERPGIVYFGAGNGKLYALNAADGTRRWSFDTTPTDAEGRDRNDLNGSVALGHSGAYIGSESGSLWFVPYDYCLHRKDQRCQTSPSADLPPAGTHLFYVTPGGSTCADTPPPINPATVVTLRLMVIENGRMREARLCDTPLLCSGAEIHIETAPPFPLRYQRAADGRHLHIVPEEILRPDTAYRLRVRGDYYDGGFRFGNLTIGGRRAGKFDQELRLRTRSAGPGPRWQPDRDETPAFEWTRLAVPIPAMLASLNQIGFDDMEWIMGAIAAGDDTLILWGVPGRRAQNVLVVDAEATSALLLSGTRRGGSLFLSARDFEASVTGIPVKLDLMELRGEIDRSLIAAPGASFLAEADALSIPTFGWPLVLSGLASGLWDRLVMSGTYVTRPYRGPANRRPQGLQVTLVESVRPTEALPGQVVAHFRLAPGASYRLSEHRVAMVLIDAVKGGVLPLDYRSRLTTSATPEGDLLQAVLTIPAGTDVSDDLEVVVLTDVFPLYRKSL